MAYSAADLSADELAWAALDKPILGHNAAVGALSDSQWVNLDTHDFTDPDISDPDKPVSRIFDGLPGLQSAADTPTGNSLALCLDFGTSGIEFDGVLCLGHNLYTEGCTRFRIKIADDDQFTVNLATIATVDLTMATSDARFADLVLGPGTARRYSDVRWVRIQLDKGAQFDPAFGQIIFLHRRQLKHQPDTPWDPTDQESGIETFEAQAGVDYNTTRYRGRRNIEASLRFGAVARQADILAWWAATEQGTRPFVWIDAPHTTPAGFLFANLRQPSLDFPYVLWGTRTFNLMGREQGPSFAAIE